MPTDFHAFTKKYDGITDRIITEVQLTRGFDPRTPPKPIPSLVTTSALWDTGATKSVITPSVAADLGVVPTGTLGEFCAWLKSLQYLPC